MKVKEFIKLNADIDVYDDVCEEVAICFCGPMMLTEEGKEHFDYVLNCLEIELDFSGSIKTAEIKCHNEFFPEELDEFNIEKANEFFCSAAGYCADEDFQKWFIEPNFGQYATDPDAMMDITVYKDATPWFTEEEIMEDNLCELSFPRKMVQDFYIANGGSINSFMEWIQDIYTADDVDGLFSFCKDRGFIAVREN